MEVKGYNGQVIFDGNSLTITRKGLGRITVGKGQIRIPISSVTAVRWKPAGPLVNGYIHFTMMGSNDRRSTFGRQTMNVGHDENSVIFLRSQMPDFEKLRTAVETAIAQNAKPQGRQHTASIPEQIAQLAALRDQSILTDEEFAAKKSSLLSQI
jgi:hypothetical protein